MGNPHLRCQEENTRYWGVVKNTINILAMNDLDITPETHPQPLRRRNVRETPESRRVGGWDNPSIE